MEYMYQTPIVVSGLMAHWPATQPGRWEEEEFLRDFGALRFSHNHFSSSDVRNGALPVDGMTLAEFLLSRVGSDVSVSSSSPPLQWLIVEKCINVPQIAFP